MEATQGGRGPATGTARQQTEGSREMGCSRKKSGCWGWRCEVAGCGVDKGGDGALTSEDSNLNLVISGARSMWVRGLVLAAELDVSSCWRMASVSISAKFGVKQNRCLLYLAPCGAFEGGGIFDILNIILPARPPPPLPSEEYAEYPEDRRLRVPHFISSSSLSESKSEYE